MALVYDGANGLFTRLGKLVKLINTVRTHQTALVTGIAEIKNEYSSTDAYMVAAIGDAEARAAEAGMILAALRTSAEQTVVEMCYAEAAGSTTNVMRAKQTGDALVWLIRQMSTDTETIERNVVGKGTITYGASNNGTGVGVALLECPNILLSNTANWPNVRVELIDIRCVQDAQSGTIGAGSEVFQVRGQPSFDSMDRRFPAGSGATMNMIAACASIDAGPRYQNIGTNTDLEEQTSNLPAQFTLSSGTAGTDFLTETTTVFRGASSIKAAATGAVFKIRQRLGSADGTHGKLSPDRPYVIAFAAIKDAGMAGTLRVSIQDSAGTVIGGASPMSATATGGSLTTSWAYITATMFAPRVIPTETYLVIESTVALTVAAAYIDDVIVAEMPQLTAGGQYLAILAGETDWNNDDFATFAFTNTYAGLWAVALDRLFTMYDLNLALPDATAGTETIADSLTT